jgi:hypothetical protein
MSGPSEDAIPTLESPGRAGYPQAEADGNRTRPPGIARRTGFEDREGHQPPFASIPKSFGTGKILPLRRYLQTALSAGVD